jgi:hypothetical protein
MSKMKIGQSFTSEPKLVQLPLVLKGLPPTNTLVGQFE